MFACRYSVVFLCLCLLHFRAEVMYCTEVNATLTPILKHSNLSSSPLRVVEHVFLCQFYVYAKRISSITCTRIHWAKEQSDEYKVAFLCLLPQYC